MDLSTYKFPEVTKVDLAFPTFNTPKELVAEAEEAAEAVAERSEGLNDPFLFFYITHENISINT